MESLIYFCLVLIANSLLPNWLPWWIIAIINFAFVFPFNLRKGIGFWLGGFASGLSWLTYSLWLSHENGHILAPRLTKLLSLPHPILLFVVVFMLPFFVGGMATVTGISLKNFIQHNGT